MEEKMGSHSEGAGSATLPEKRIVLIGGRWGGKSCSGNTILRGERFECGRARTNKVEVKHGEVEGSRLTIVDTPGWSSSLSLTDIPEGEKQSFKLYASKSPPGPHVFLLVVPIDLAFTQEHRTTLEEHMKMLGERVWRFVMVLFTCGDYLGEKTIEQHIESEGDSLKWLVGKCGYRYHVFNNKDNHNLRQVSGLLQKIDEMMKNNNGGAFYKIDDQTLQIITRKQEDVARRADERRTKAEEQRQRRIKLIPGEKKSIPKLQMILLGSRNVGKTAVGNTLFGFREQEDGKRTAKLSIRKGFVDKTDVTLVDTPGWWKSFAARDTPEAIKEEIINSMFLCSPGPHIFLLVIDADASFHNRNLKAAKSHLQLLGGELVWKHTVIVFTRGDWLGAKSIEEYIEGEGEALGSLVDLCDNKYHVINNKNPSDRRQITELMEKITETVAENNWNYFAPDQQLRVDIEKRRKRVEEAAILRQKQVKAMRRSAGSRKRLDVLRVLLLGQKSSGKSATGNTILGKEVFVTCQNEECKVENGMADGRQITVIDTPGWWRDLSRCTEETDKEMVRGVPKSGVHGVLLLVPLNPTFRDEDRVAVEEHMNLFGNRIWKHTIVVFTHGDKLAERSIEEHIEREPKSLGWLVDQCENRYHSMNMKKRDKTQVAELFEKIEEIVAGNGGQLFCPNMEETHQRISEKAHRKQLKNVLTQRLESEYRRRELELLLGFKGTLLELQADLRISMAATKPKLPIVNTTNLRTMFTGHWMKDQKTEQKELESKISQEIEKLDKELLKSSTVLQRSMDVLIPDLADNNPTQSIVCSSSDPKASSSNFDKVLGWLAKLHVTTNLDNQLTVNFSDTSGYRSVLSMDYDSDSIVNK